MAIEVVMPQLGLSMDSGQIIGWLKSSGDRVEPGDLLLEVESDKASVEVESVESGILHIIRGPEHGSVQVGDVIAYILAEGEKPPEIEVGEIIAPGEIPGLAPETGFSTEPEMSRIDRSVVVAFKSDGRRPPSSPAARRRAKELGVDWRYAIPTGPENVILERDVIALASTDSGGPGPQLGAKVEIQISPLALRLAESTGVSIEELAEHYPDRRIEREEVEQHIRGIIQRSKSLSGLPPQPYTEKTPIRREKVGRLRQIIAERMTHSARTYAPVTLTTEGDATELVGIRGGLKADPHTDVVPSYNALIARLVAKVLLEFPDVNASLEGDEIIYWNTINIGIAVDTERGLVVPVIRDAHLKNAREIESELATLLPRVKEGKAMPDELSGSTFTITNLGIYDIDGFTPIINPPESAVLGVGRLVDKWIVVNGEPEIRTMLSLSLTFDHRLVDGAPAARCLQRIKQSIEKPYLWLV